MPQAGGQFIAGLGLCFTPEGHVFGMFAGGGQAQQKEVIGGTETRMRQQAQHPLALACAEARLQQPDFLHGQRETARQGHGGQLVQGDPVGGTALRFLRIHATGLQSDQRAAIGWPQ